MRRWLVPPLTALLAGCLVGPNYQRPQLTVPESFRHQAGDTRQSANTEWWKQFEDPVLDGLITEALANNWSVKIAAANVEQAAAVLSQVRAPLLPQVNAGGAAARQRVTELGATPVPPSVSNPQTAYQVTAGASWELDLWGRLRRLSEASRADLLASEEARRGVVLSLVAAVANGYVQLRAADDQLAIVQRSLDDYAESVRLLELKFRHGLVSQMNVEQARTQYETAAATIPQIASQITQTENALSVLLGRQPGPIPRGKAIHELAMPAIPAGLPSEVLEQRPDLTQAEQALIAANARIGAAKARYFPTISLTGVFGQASAELDNLFKGPARVWSYAGSVAAPIFTGGAVSGQVRQAEAVRNAALAAYEAAVQSAFADADNALAVRVNLAEQVQAQQRLVAASAEYVRLARLQYNGGVAPYSTVLQAEQQLFPAELSLAQVRAALFSSTVNIYKATGGGWVAEAERLTGVTADQAAAK